MIKKLVHITPPVFEDTPLKPPFYYPVIISTQRTRACLNSSSHKNCNGKELERNLLCIYYYTPL